MDIKTFEALVKPGDNIILYTEHWNDKRDTRNFVFLGYQACGGCAGEPCPGYVRLLNKATKIEIQGCFRSENNIRLEIKRKTKFLPDELFEV